MARLKRFASLASLALLAFGVLATGMALIPTNTWWVRWFDFPRVLFALVLIVALALVAILGPRRKSTGLLALVGVLSVAYQVYRIFPYTPLASYDVPAAEECRGNSLQVMTANVLMSNERVGDLLEIVRRVDPDVLFVVETNAMWAEALNPLEADYPHRISEPLDNTYGLDLFSRYPLSDTQLRYLIEDDIPSVTTLVRLPSGRDVLLYGIHPRPPRPDSDTEQRDGELITVAREVSERARPTVVVGDLNDVAWSATTRLFRDVGGLHDPRIGRGLFASFHAGNPLFRWPLDHVFTSESFSLEGLEVLEGFGSDHFPISTRLCLTGEADAPEPTTPEQAEEAEEVIEEAHEAEQVDGPEEAH